MRQRDPGRAHSNRRRAESFGQVAEEYDRYRPSYPGALLDRLVALAGAGPVLDVGAGTGREARQLMDRGVSVLAVEVDAGMAAVARRHGVEVDVAAFEDWHARGLLVDLIVSGQAWHWIDPVRGPANAHRLLRPGGTLALFWNFSELPADVEALVQRVYELHAPELADASVARSGGPGTVPGHVPALREAGFAVRTERFGWHTTETPEQYVARLGTHSDHCTLPPERLQALQDALLAALRGRAAIALDYGTEVLWCRRDRRAGRRPG